MARKNDEDRRIRFLENQVRELKATKRSLLRQLKKVNKGYRKLRDEEPEEGNQEEDSRPTCPECSAPITAHELMGRSWNYCKSCQWKSKTKLK